MSEVKTFKCDICGDIHHSFADTHEITVFVKDREGNNKCYQHICPSCENNIHKVIDNPSVIDDLIVDKDETRGYMYILETYIDSIKYTLFGITMPRFFMGLSKRKKYYKEMTDEITTECEKIIKFRDRWFTVGIISIGIAVVSFAHLLAQVL